MANYDLEAANERFEEEVKSLLSGYLESSDTVGYLALKIKNLHMDHLEEALAANEQ
jgi:hypothetical protein